MLRLLGRSATMLDTTVGALIEAVRHAAHPLTGVATDYDPLLEIIGDARFVLIGEASRGIIYGDWSDAG